MVAVVSGSGLGLFNASNNILGGTGVLGSGSVGRTGGLASVNAATGNLVLQFNDEMLSGRGADLFALRTYNSRGTLQNGLGTGWRWDGERTIKLSGTRNAAGSTITRTDGDGHETLYSLSGSVYRSTEGSGAHDEFTFDSTTSQWVWTNGSTRMVERYSDSVGGALGLLQRQIDASGKVIVYTYKTGTNLLETVTDLDSGQKLTLAYKVIAGQNRLEKITTDAVEQTFDNNGVPTGTVTLQTLKQVEYEYFNDAKLKSVKTVLKPQSGTAQYFVTGYTYDATSGGVASITQGDGVAAPITMASFEYISVDSAWRVSKATEGGVTQKFTYKTVSGVTSTDITIGDHDRQTEQTWSYTYNADGLLTRIDSPAPTTGAARLVTQFNYDPDLADKGNVTSIVDPRGKVITYGYDANGNRTLERDALGNTIKRLFSAKNELLTETRYTGTDPEGDGTVTGTALITRFLYDDNSRLRFVISPEGRVSETRYNVDGLIDRAIRYTTDRFVVDEANPPITAGMTTWAADTNRRSKIQLSQYFYDPRGNLSKRSDFATVGSDGNGVIDAAATITEYVYDGHGALVQTIAVRGSARDQRSQFTAFATDGMGRQIYAVGANGVQTTVYGDGANTMTVSSASGLTTLTSFDGAGRISSINQTGSSTTRTSTFSYDDQSRLYMTQDALGGRHFNFYDAAGRLAFTVDSRGEVCGYSYRADGRMTSQLCYGNRVVSDMNAWINANPPKTTLVIGGEHPDLTLNATLDRTTTYVYDDAGRLITATDAGNAVTASEYDGANRLTKTTQQGSANRVTQYFYDGDGRQVGVLDPLGYLTENKYDAAGRLIETIRYATRSATAAAINVAAPVWIGVTNQTAVGGQAFIYRMQASDADGDGLNFTVVGSKPDWLTLDTSNPNFPTLKGIPPAGLATYSITIRADDKRSTAKKSTDVTVQIAVLNSAPMWSAPDDVAVRVGTSGFSFKLPLATDNETAQGSLIYSITSALPPGLSFLASATEPKIIGTPTNPGTYLVAARVADGTGSSALFTEKTFVIQVTNDGPSWFASFAPEQLKTFRNADFSLAVPLATDPEGEALTYSAISLPAGLSLVMQNGVPVITGKPTTKGTAQLIKLQASDPRGETVQLWFTIDVNNRAPSWPALPELPPGTDPNAQTPVKTVLAGNDVNYILPSALDPDADAMTYSMTPPWEGLSVNGATGLISGAPRFNGRIFYGNIPLVVTATDTSGVSVSRNILFRMIDGPVRFEGSTGDPEREDVVTGTGSTEQSRTRSFSIFKSNFVDPNHDTLTFTASGGNMRASQDANVIDFEVTFPSFSKGLRTFNVSATATDPFGSSVTVRYTVQYMLMFELPPPDPNQLTAEGGAATVPGDMSTFAAVPAPADAVVAAAAAVVTDPLADWRPASSSADLHSFLYYDAQGRAIGRVDERGVLSETVYDEVNNRRLDRSYMKPVTATASSTFEGLKNDSGAGAANLRTITSAFDSRGRLASITGFDGSISSNEYDAAGRLVRQVSGGSSFAEQRVTRTFYDAFDDVTATWGGVAEVALQALITQQHPQITAEDITNTIDAYGVRAKYDALGRRTQMIARQDDGTDVTTLYFYDSESRLTHTVSSIGQVTELIYDAFGAATETRRYLTQVRNGTDNPLLNQLKAGTKGRAHLLEEIATFPDNGYLRSSVTYNTRGLVKTSTDAEGYLTTNEYTAFGQLETQTRIMRKAQGSQSEVDTTTRFDYDLRGALLAQTGDVGGLNFITRSEYDAFGRVLKSIDAAGVQTGTAYDKGGRIIEVTLDNSGGGLNRKLRTEYDALGRTLFVTDAANQVTEYTYDDTLRTIRITTPEGVSMLTEKNRFGETFKVTTGIGKTDTAGKTTVYQYDADGHLKDVTDAVGNPVAHNDYGKDGMLLSTRDANGIVATLRYDAVNRLIERVVDPGTGKLNRTTTYKLDVLDRWQRVTESQGSEIAQVTAYTYDGNGRLVRITVDPDGLKLNTNFTYDGLGDTITIARGVLADGLQHQQVTQYVFDKLGRRVEEIIAPSGVFGFGSARERDLTTRYRYDTVGRVSRKIDATGQSTWYVYDASGAITANIDAEGGVTRNQYDANGRLVQTTAYSIKLADSVLAGFGDAVTVVSPSDSDSDARAIRVYDKDGRLHFTLQAIGNGAGTKWSVAESVFDPKSNNVVERRVYDTALPQAQLAPLESGGVTLAEVNTALTNLYKDDGVSTNPLDHARRTRFVYDADDRLHYAVDALGAVTESIYDAAGRVVATVQFAAIPALSGTLDETVVNNAVNRNNPANRVARFAYDTANRLRFTARVLAANGSGQATEILVSEQRYDALGRVITSIGYATSVKGTFNAADFNEANLKAKLSANLATDRLSATGYDAAGRAVFQVQASAVDNTGARLHSVFKLEYDALGQVVKTTAYATALALADYKIATVTGAITSAVANHADNRVNQFIYDKVGRLHFAVAADGSFSETLYDAQSRIIETRQFNLRVKSSTPLTEDGLAARRGVRRVGDGVTHGSKIVYDRAGRARFVVAADGSLRETVYDALGLVREMRQFADVSVTAGTAVSVAGLTALRGSRVVGDGSTRGETVVYDRVGRRQTATDAGSVDPISNTLVRGSMTYTYDAFGDLRVRTDQLGKEWLNSYDAVGRLKMQLAPAALVQLSNENAPLQRALATEFVYDALGNLTSRTEAKGTLDARVTAYEYDSLGRQTKMSLPGWYDTATGRVEASGKDNNNQPIPTRFQRTMETTYDAFGNDLRTSTRTGTGSSDFIHEYKTYDALSRVRQRVDPLGHVTALGYNALGDQDVITQYSRTVTPPTNSGNLWTRATLDAALAGDTVTRVASTQFDARGRKIKTTLAAPANYSANRTGTEFNVGASPAPTVTLAQTVFDYNAFGELSHQAVLVNAEGSDVPGRSGQWRDVWHYYDALGREARMIDAGGFNTVRTYDALGNLKRITEYAQAGARPALLDPNAPVAAPPSSPPLPATSPDDRATEYEFDARNLLTKMRRHGLAYDTLVAGAVDTDGKPVTLYNRTTNGADQGTVVEENGYDVMGRQVLRKDALQNRTVTSYDVLGRVSSVEEVARDVAVAGALNPFATETAGARPVMEYTYNAFGQMVTQKRKLGGTELLRMDQGYDASGNLVSLTDARRNVLNRKVDYAGRVIEETQSIAATLGDWNSVAHTLKRRFAYDTTGRQIATLDIYDNGASQSGMRKVYNAFGEIAEERRIYGAAGTALDALTQPLLARYTYDGAGRLKTREGNDGTTTYFYDLSGEVTRQEQAARAINNVTTPSKRITETGYDILGRAQIQRLPFAEVNQLLSGDYVAVGGMSLVEQTFDRWGNVLTRTQGAFTRSGGVVERGESRTVTYVYDDDNRVIRTLTPVMFANLELGDYYAQTWHETEYDLLGRAVRELDVADNVLTAAIERSALRERSREFDAANQLTVQTDSTRNRTEYAYDARGNRVGTKDAEGHIYTDEFDANGNLTSHGVLRTVNGVLTRIVVSRFQYDQANRQVASIDVKNDTDSHEFGSYTLYDERGLVLARATPTDYAQSGTGTLIHGFSERRFGYDALGNKTSERDRASTTDSARFEQNWVYDLNNDFFAGRLLNSTVLGVAGTWTYEYTGFGQISKETAPSNPDEVARGGFLGLNERRYFYNDNGTVRLVVNETSAGVLGAVAAEDYTTTTDLTSFYYGANGEVVREVFQRTGKQEVFSNGTFAMPGPPNLNINHETRTEYDALGRVVRVWTPAATNAGSELLTNLIYGYDELGNRRHVVADYVIKGQQSNPQFDRWNRFDAEGRITLVNGTTSIEYDKLGRRKTELTTNSRPRPTPLPGGPPPEDDYWQFHDQERYSYNDLGYLTRIEQTDQVGNFLTEEIRKVDTQGNVLQMDRFDEKFSPRLHTQVISAYRADNQLLAQTSTRFDAQNQPAATSVLSNHDYDVAGLLRNASMHTTLAQPNDDNPNFHIDYNYQYSREFGGFKLDVATWTKRKDGSNSFMESEEANSLYDWRGQQINRVVLNKVVRVATFAYGVDGQMVHKEEGGRTTDSNPAPTPGTMDFFYAGGKHIAMLGDGSLLTARFSNDYQPFSSTNPSSYIVTSGDTLERIAQKVYGDAQLWYLIADTNSLGFGPDTTLPIGEQGRSYRIPPVVGGVHNNADTALPFDAAKVLGMSDYYAPPPGPNFCDKAKAFTAQAVAVVVTIAVTMVVSYYTGSQQLGATVGSAVGNFSGQLTGLALGTRKSLSGTEVLEATMAGFASSALGGATASVAGGASAGIWAQAAAAGIEATIEEVGRSALNGFKNWDNWRGIAASVFNVVNSSSAAAAGAWAGQSNGWINFKWSGAVAQFNKELFHPETGLVIGNKPNDWSMVALDALSSSASFVGQNLVYLPQRDQLRKENRDIAEALRTGRMPTAEYMSGAAEADEVLQRVQAVQAQQEAARRGGQPRLDDTSWEDGFKESVRDGLARMRQRQRDERAIDDIWLDVATAQRYYIDGSGEDASLFQAPRTAPAYGPAEDPSARAERAVAALHQQAAELGLDTPEKRAAYLTKTYVIEDPDALNVLRGLDQNLQERYDLGHFDYQHPDDQAKDLTLGRVPVASTTVLESEAQRLNYEAAYYLGAVHGAKDNLERFEYLREHANTASIAAYDGSVTKPYYPDWHQEAAPSLQVAFAVFGCASNVVACAEVLTVSKGAELLALQLGASPQTAELIGFGTGFAIGLGGLSIPRFTKGLRGPALEYEGAPKSLGRGQGSGIWGSPVEVVGENTGVSAGATSAPSSGTYSGPLVAERYRPLSVVDGFEAPQGFSGVYNPVTGRVVLKPSPTDAAQTLLPKGWVLRQGGHIDTALETERLHGDKLDDMFGHGYAVIKRLDGNLDIGWKSTGLNPRGPLGSANQYLTPIENRAAIVRAVEDYTGIRITGWKVPGH